MVTKYTGSSYAWDGQFAFKVIFIMEVQIYNQFECLTLGILTASFNIMKYYFCFINMDF